MKRLTVPVRLVFLLLLPLGGVTGFGAWGAWSKLQTRRAFTDVRVTSTALIEIAEVIHELQRERGRSNTFCASQGAKFVRELPAQQQATNVALIRFERIRGPLERLRFGADFDAAYQQAKSRLAELEARRDAINRLQLSGPESTAYFTGLISDLLHVMISMNNTIDDAAIANAMGTFITIAHMKEFAGIERALIAGTFAADKFSGDIFARVNQAIAGQDAFYRVFQRYATPEQAELFSRTVQGAEVDRAAAMRQLALDRAATGGFAADPAVWFDAITARIDLLKKVGDGVAVSFVQGAETRERQAQRSFAAYLCLTLVILALTSGFGVWCIRSITGPLKEIIGELTATADQTAIAAGQVSESSQGLAQGSTEQAARLEETSAAVTEILATTKRNADSAQRAKEYSNQTRASAEAGTQHVTQMNEAMSRMKVASEGIGKIIKTIDEIAFQTNILALNAAVEAARAGEAGLGFSIVADEVKNLARRSAESARETAMRIEEAIRRSDDGARISSAVSAALGEIVEKARHVDEFVVDIAEASIEQNRGVAQVNEAVEQMDRITQGGAANAEETAAAAEELSAQSLVLRTTVQTLAGMVEHRRDSTEGHHRSPLRVTSSEHTPRPTQRKPLPFAAADRKSQQAPANGKAHAMTFS